jgi:hypothetical protein
MEFEAKLHARQGDAGLFAVSGIDWHAVNRKATGKAILYLEDRDKISDEQRKLLFALWRDYETYTGVPLDAVEAWFKYEYMLHADLDGLPSVSRNGMSKHLATDFITYTLEYYLANGIPFQQADWYKGADIQRVCYAMLIKRICFACGKENSDVHHLNGSTIGMGNDRRKVSHVGRMVVCLCRECHGKIHQGGEKAFFNKHHIAPIRLSEEDVRKLGI